jgi:hypothetical protein
LVASASDQTSGLSEELAIHGDWTIDIRNPDGSLVSHREFENLLTSPGKSTVAGILSGSQSAGGWSIGLVSTNGEEICTDDGGNPVGVCEIQELENIGDAGNVFKNLDVEPVGIEDDGIVTSWGINLSGSVIARLDGEIFRVLTNLGTCTDTTSPMDCNTPSSVFFTTKDISPVSTVIQGQFIDVSVLLTFPVPPELDD